MRDKNICFLTHISYDVYIYIYMHICIFMGFPGGSDGKESAHNAGVLGSISGLE